MVAEQREARQPVVEENIVLPRQFGVAVSTPRPHGTAMRVVILMTRQAVRSRRCIEDRLDMASGTFSISMCTQQRMTRVDVMIEMHVRPPGRRMTGIAGTTEVPVVVVVVFVTGDAGRTQAVGERVGAMVTVASLLGVHAIEGKLCVALMIEARFVPTNRAVAIAAFGTAAPVVRVVLGMAGITCRRRILERVVGVTVKTPWSLVVADQRKAGRVVIELNVQPALGCMAVAALRAESARMCVIAFVTGKAITRRVPTSYVRYMAVAALLLGMSAQQGKPRQVMIEPAFVQTNNVGVATLVVRMAVRAGRPFRTTIHSVKTRLGFDVCGDFIVAIETQRALLFTVKAKMAITAFFFEFGVGLSQFARHDQRLKLSLCWS